MVDRLALAALLLLASACAQPPAAGPVSRQEPARQESTAQTPAAPEREHAPALPAPVALPAAPGEAGVRAFLDEFMAARVRGDAARARDFLSPTALDQYESLGLTASAGSTYAGWELVSLNAADASSYEVTVRVRGDSTFVETLFIGPGPDASETQRPWIVRGVTRS